MTFCKAGAVRIALAFFLAGVVGLATPLPGAVPLVPGGPTVLVPPIFPTPADVGVEVAQLLSPFSFTTTAGTTSGTLATAVYLNGTGTLDFYYQITNDSTSKTSIARETNTNFEGFITDVDFILTGSTLPGQTVFVLDGIEAPITADSSGSPPGGVIGFTFFPPLSAKINPGDTSAVFVISTNATRFKAGNSSVIDGGTATVAAFQPAAIPEPATLVLVGLGLIGAGAARRFRR